ncbi:MAG: glycosyltransferase family 4 protein, partial [Bdellovibrionales bacterium]|nr:glycosyltransferase family 4 protein [Bdellovibrionales bacterium]
LTVCQALSEKARSMAPHVRVVQIEDFPLESSARPDLSLVGRLRADYGLSNKQVIVYTGNFESYQGIDLLLEAFALLCSADGSEPAARPMLLLVGGGDDEAPLVQRYREKARMLGVSSSVIFAGQQPPEHMGSFMSLADVLASPRIVGGNTPLKVYSYMAAERPVVATAISSHRQVLDESTCYLAAPAPGEFSQALRRALADRRERSIEGTKRVQQAKSLVDSRFSEGAFRQRLKQLYRSLLRAEIASDDLPLPATATSGPVLEERRASNK